jgi:hypothetical protein
MKSEFEILISFRTPDGFKACGQYFLGKDKAFAEEVFAGLAGREDIGDKCVLHLDLMETTDGLPVKVRSVSCKLSELCANCEYITRELFRVHAVERPD